MHGEAEAGHLLVAVDAQRLHANDSASPYLSSGAQMAGRAAGWLRKCRSLSQPAASQSRSLRDIRRQVFVQKAVDLRPDLRVVRLEREVTRVVKVTLGVRIVTLESLSTGRCKKRVVLAPDGQ